MSPRPENPFGPTSGSMGDWLLTAQRRRPKRIRTLLVATEVVPTALSETVQPTEEKVPDQPTVVKVGPVK